MIVGDEEHRAFLSAAGDGEKAVSEVERQAVSEVERALHKLIQKVGQDVEAMKFNTAIAAMMEFVNLVYKAGSISTSQAERFVLVLAPFAPHLGEELWQRLGHGQSLAYEPFPQYDQAMLAQETIELPVQVNGKLRGRIQAPCDATQEQVLEIALAEPKIAAALAGKTILKKIVVPGRMVNLVVK
jgi:leucyl-tRNA synthetase